MASTKGDGMSRARITGLLLVAAAALIGRADAGEQARWTRADRVEGTSLTLSVAVREFAPKEGDGPVVALVGVVHVGDVAYYRALQRHMAKYDVVLYESVKPSGAGAPRGETDEERVESTRRTLRFLASLVEAHRAAGLGLPADVGALVAWLEERDVRLRDFVDLCLRDAWGGEVAYVLAGDGEAASFRLSSLGADGATGGEGVAADLVVGTEDEVPPLTRPEGDSLQVSLAKTLRLVFQLDVMDYSGERWIPSDMAMDEVERAIAARGGNPKALSGSLTGSAFGEGIARIALGIIRVGDLFTGGLLGDAMKALLIEMLADESMDLVEESPLGEAVMRVIIDDRNRHVVDDLERLLDSGTDAESVAVFYGAGHMKDLEKRLADRLGYEPIPESAAWFPAIRLDLENSKVSQEMIDSLRATVRRRLEQMRKR
jgi:hypothetical protein